MRRIEAAGRLSPYRGGEGNRKIRGPSHEGVVWRGDSTGGDGSVAVGGSATTVQLALAELAQRQMAADGFARRCRAPGRDFFFADRARLPGAAPREGAGLGRRGRLQGLALDHAPLAGALEARHRQDQAVGIGVEGRCEDVGRVAGLHQLAAEHHRHPVGELAHHREVMGEEEHRHLVAPAQPAQQLEDIGLDRDVEGRAPRRTAAARARR